MQNLDKERKLLVNNKIITEEGYDMYIVESIIIGISILCGCIILGRYISSIKQNNEIGTFQIVKVDEKNIVILDTRTGHYWKKPIVENSSVKTNSKETDKYV